MSFASSCLTFRDLPHNQRSCIKTCIKNNQETYRKIIKRHIDPKLTATNNPLLSSILLSSNDHNKKNTLGIQVQYTMIQVHLDPKLTATNNPLLLSILLSSIDDNKICDNKIDDKINDNKIGNTIDNNKIC